MVDVPSLAAFRNVMRLVQKMRSRKYRESYVGAHLRQFLARQMRALRGEMSQTEFGDVIGKPQNVVSRYEDPYYGKWTLTSLLEVAARTDRALIVRFVDFPTFLKFTNDQSEAAACPAPYDQKKLEWSASLIVAERGGPFSDYEALIRTNRVPAVDVAKDEGVAARGGAVMELT